jgi:putative FmdB family regulatory protein
MPVYEYQCPEGHVTTALRSVVERERVPECPCGHLTRKVILSPPKVFGDYEGYESPASGRWVEGRRARLEDLKRTQSRPYESGERQEFEKRRVAADRALDKTVDDAVDWSIEAITH